MSELVTRDWTSADCAHKLRCIADNGFVQSDLKSMLDYLNTLNYNGRWIDIGVLNVWFSVGYELYVWAICWWADWSGEQCLYCWRFSCGLQIANDSADKFPDMWMIGMLMVFGFRNLQLLAALMDLLLSLVSVSLSCSSNIIISTLVVEAFAFISVVSLVQLISRDSAMVSFTFDFGR